MSHNAAHFTLMQKESLLLKLSALFWHQHHNLKEITDIVGNVPICFLAKSDGQIDINHSVHSLWSQSQKAIGLA